MSAWLVLSVWRSVLVSCRYVFFFMCLKVLWFPPSHLYANKHQWKLKRTKNFRMKPLLNKFATFSWIFHAGFYCPEGTGFDQRSCPEGTYGPDPGYWSVSQCRQCDGGHYCSSTNSTSVSGPCQEGYYCTYGNTSPQPLLVAKGELFYIPLGPFLHPHHYAFIGIYSCWFCVLPVEGGPCPAGHYCPGGSIFPLPCPRGTFSNLTKLVSQVNMTPCCTQTSFKLT